ncbi:MAG: hypothetical protein JWO78_812 [Micavibrio sp.]|nr:hypothetical protein [Micavibrio sp.]
MDSKLDSLFRTNFQPTQQTDTWQGIRREEPHDDRQKKNKRKAKEDDEFGDDEATLSVLALHEFLKNLLTQAGEKMPETLAQTLPDEELGDGPRPYDPASAHAAKAYQTTARAAPGQRIDFSEHPAGAATAPPGPAIALSAEELRLMHKLLDDIEALGQRGIGFIPLVPADSFLESLALGVQAVSG